MENQLCDLVRFRQVLSEKSIIHYLSDAASTRLEEDKKEKK